MALRHLRSFIEAFIAVFAPIHLMLGTVFLLVAIDLITGMAVAWKQGKPIVSGKIKVTVIKLLVYELAICLAYLVGKELVGDSIPVLNMVTSIIGLTELKSVLENTNTLAGGGLLDVIVNAIGKSGSDKDKGA